MKHYYDDFEYEENLKPLNTPLAKEQKSGGFRCSHCHMWVVINPYIGTANRNHCNICLWSRHVDIQKGDRLSECRGGMRPICLTLKHEGFGRVGELMLVHECCSCGKLSINRIARDDFEDEVMHIFEQSHELDSRMRQQLEQEAIEPLDDVGEVRRQLFGM